VVIDGIFIGTDAHAQNPFPARSISKKLGINVQAMTNPETSGNNDIFRGIREQLASLLDGLDPKDLATMSLGLSHSLSR
jgi:nucleolar protein 58